MVIFFPLNMKKDEYPALVLLIKVLLKQLPVIVPGFFLTVDKIRRATCQTKTNSMFLIKNRSNM